jgi:hypothetical protein
MEPGHSWKHVRKNFSKMDGETIDKFFDPVKENLLSPD